jgi:hypothetical protein
MDVLLNIVDLRRLLLDNLGPVEICYFVESRNDFHRDKIEEDYNYWVKRIQEQYNIPEHEVVNLLHATPEVKHEAENVNNGLYLGNSPCDIFLFLTPGQYNRPSYNRPSYKKEDLLPGCDITNYNYNFLPKEVKDKYPLAKYNCVPPRECVYIFQRGTKQGMKCSELAIDGSDFCFHCKKYPSAIKMFQNSVHIPVPH